MTTPAPTHFDVQPTVGNHFSWINTMLALQRTLMSATRTAVSLIGFGFTVAQFFQRMRDTAPAGVRVMKAAGPRNFGLALIAAGVFSLIIFAWQYHDAVSRLWKGEFGVLAGDAQRAPLFAPVYITAVVVIMIGLAAFVVVFARL